MTKPVFKYIGGKRWMKDILEKKVSNSIGGRNIDSYCEPFCGGLGSFISVSQVLINHNIHNVVLNDINGQLPRPEGRGL